MTDLIERLRREPRHQLGDHSRAMHDAADEIERLRGQLGEARSIIDDLRFHDLSGRADKFMGNNPFQLNKP